MGIFVHERVRVDMITNQKKSQQNGKLWSYAYSIFLKAGTDSLIVMFNTATLLFLCSKYKNADYGQIRWHISTRTLTLQSEFDHVLLNFGYRYA